MIFLHPALNDWEQKGKVGNGLIQARKGLTDHDLQAGLSDGGVHQGPVFSLLQTQLLAGTLHTHSQPVSQSHHTCGIQSIGDGGVHQGPVFSLLQTQLLAGTLYTHTPVKVTPHVWYTNIYACVCVRVVSILFLLLHCCIFAFFYSLYVVLVKKEKKKSFNNNNKSTPHTKLCARERSHIHLS